ncbi:MAG: transposase [Gemmatimonas sp.]|uniref:IS256 family transposase n=1 Tax=Gemmatimonas sp. TaxID=1962908 RepID=UPI00391F5B69
MPRVRTQSPVHQSPPPTPSAAPAPVEANSLAVAMIQALIPLGLQAVEDAQQQEVLALAGPRYTHADGRPAIARWGAQAGSVFLADQKVPIQVPRVRHRATNTEVPLATHAHLQTPRGQDVGLFRRLLGGLSCRDDEAAAEAVPEAFGLTTSSVSRRFVRASAKALQTLHERRHDDEEWLVLLLDGKSFADDQGVIALGVTTTGEKRIVGLVQTATENTRVCAAFLRELVARGFQAPAGLLVVLDGAKGLSAAVRDVFGEQVPIQRSQWHQRENVLSDLPKTQHALWRCKLQAAYAKATHGDAQRALRQLVKELERHNASAARSLQEGLDETVTLHRLEVFTQLGVSFKTTNLIERVMARVEAKTHRITRWRTSDQKQRWCAATLLEIEKQVRTRSSCRSCDTRCTMAARSTSAMHAATR